MQQEWSPGDARRDACRLHVLQVRRREEIVVPAEARLWTLLLADEGKSLVARCNHRGIVTTTASASTTGHECLRRLPGYAYLHPVRLQSLPARDGDRRRGGRRHIRESGTKGVSLSGMFSDADGNRGSEAFDVNEAARLITV